MIIKTSLSLYFIFPVYCTKFHLVNLEFQNYTSADSTCFNVSAIIAFLTILWISFDFYIIGEETLSSSTKWIMKHLYDPPSLSFPKDASFLQTVSKFSMDLGFPIPINTFFFSAISRSLFAFRMVSLVLLFS